MHEFGEYPLLKRGKPHTTWANVNHRNVIEGFRSSFGLSEREKGESAIALKQFRFKLQTVLDYRVEQVDREHQHLAVEQQKKAEIQERILLKEKSIQEAFQQQQDLIAKSGIDPIQSQFFPGYILRLRQQILQEKQALANQEKKVWAAQEVLKQALMKKKSLELLREKEHKRFVQKVEKAEEAMLAELALNRLYYQSKG